MQALGRRFCPAGDRYLFVARKRDDLPKFPSPGKLPLPVGYGSRARDAKLVAHREGCQVVVYCHDCDSPDSAVWAKIRAEIQDGFDSADRTNTAAAGIIGLGCIPMAMSESWLLADPAAWQSLGLRDTRILPKAPERIWGQHDDPNSQHPKKYFERACEHAGVVPTRETRVDLAGRIDLDTLAGRCPTSFGGFRSDVQAACGRLAAWHSAGGAGSLGPGAG